MITTLSDILFHTRTVLKRKSKGEKRKTGRGRGEEERERERDTAVFSLLVHTCIHVHVLCMQRCGTSEK